MEAALYDDSSGFFAGAGGGAGRAGADFMTSPEVGRLFGVLVARWADDWWSRLGHPDPYLVIDAGAGRGQLARTVLAAAPRCAPALRYVLVERSAALRNAQLEGLGLEPAAQVLGPAVASEPDERPEPVPGTGPLSTALGELPAFPFTGLVVANELLDNLPFRIVERDASGGWSEVRVGPGTGSGAAEGFQEVLVPADERLAVEAEALAAGTALPAGTRLPLQLAATGWLEDVGGVLRRGAVAVIDYAGTVEELAARGQEGWLRTYRGQRRGGSPLRTPGDQDITADVCLEMLRRAARRAGLAVVADTTQADWLRSLGVDELVAEARSAWHGRASNDLAALAARSLVHEADALTDPAGLGAHRVLILEKA